MNMKIIKFYKIYRLENNYNNTDFQIKTCRWTDLDFTFEKDAVDTIEIEKLSGEYTVLPIYKMVLKGE